MEYAKTHGIPLIDVFDKSVDKNGDGNLIYLNAADYIHPSPSGVVFISQIIADSIFQQKIF